MDIMAKVNEIVEAITKNDDLMDQFKKDPMEAVKGLLGGLDLDKEALESLVKGVQGKIDMDKAMDLVKGVQDKIDADKAKDLLGGLKNLF